MEIDGPDDNFIKRLDEDTNELISKLGVDVTAVGTYSSGSARYRAVA